MNAIKSSSIAFNPASTEAPIYIGWAECDITPLGSVALYGRPNTRITSKVISPLTCTALALEIRHPKATDYAIMVSCDLIGIRDETLQDRFREKVRAKLPPGFDMKKVFLNATHNHTGPSVQEGKYQVPDSGIMTPTQYVEFLYERLQDAVVRAWENRKPQKVSWALGHASVGYCVRTLKTDDKWQWYGWHARGFEDFGYLESSQDTGIEMLFIWDQSDKLAGIVLNIACEAITLQKEKYISADFWHDIKSELRKKYGRDLYLFPQCGASCDQMPDPMLRQDAEELMRNRKGVSLTQEIGLRVAAAVEYALPEAKKDMRSKVAFRHIVEEMKLPRRIITETEFQENKADYDRLHDRVSNKKPEQTPDDFWLMVRNKEVLERYDDQEQNPTYSVELHLIRLGDIAIVTNPFVLFLDYGLQIKARCKALQTFVVQLACADGGRVPTTRAMEAGGFGTHITGVLIGPEGGQKLVNETVKLTNEMWEPANP